MYKVYKETEKKSKKLKKIVFRQESINYKLLVLELLKHGHRAGYLLY